MIQNTKNTLLNKPDNARISFLKEHTEGLQTEIYFLREKTYMKRFDFDLTTYSQR